MKTKTIIIIGAILGILFLIGTASWFFLRSVSNEPSILLNEFNTNLEETGSLEELSQTLARGENIESLKYNVEITDNSQTSVMRFWQNKEKIRIEMSIQEQEIVNLIDTKKEIAYIFLPVQNTARKIDISQVKEILESSIKEQSISILDYNPTILGKERVDNKECLIVEYLINNQKVKMWIWEEYGLPIKTEFLIDQNLIKHQVKNIEFVDIPDNVFELPPGVQTIEIPDFY